MRKQYEDMYDKELLNLNSEIIWENSDSKDLKNNLINDLNRITIKTKVNKILNHALGYCGTALVALIAFILVGQYDFKVDSISMGSMNNGSSPSETAIIDRDISVVFSKEDQDLIESLKGNKTLFLTKEANIRHDLNEVVPLVINNPKISVTKEKDLILVNATYPIKKGKSLSINSSINHHGSSKLAYDWLVNNNPNYKLVDIGNRQGVLIRKDSEKQELVLISQKFIYYISGELSNKDLINIGKTIKFNKP
jgi:hypothetical protein